MTLVARLESATRALIAIEISDQVQVLPVPCWSDGEAVWTALPGAGPLVGALRAAPGFAVRAGEVVGRGSARVFGPHDPIGLLVHGPIVSTAMGALVLRHPGELRHALELLPVRIALDEPWILEPPPVTPGIAPALPAQVPAEVRRRLSGLSGVLVALPGVGGVELVPAVWGAGFALGEAFRASAGVEVAAVVTDGEAGVALTGELDRSGSLLPVHASWWSGGRAGAAALPPASRGAVILPD